MKKLTKLVGLKKSEFDEIVRHKGNDSQITLRPARLIPALKTGDEMALTSIFLSTIRLVKEFRDVLFGELVLNYYEGITQNLKNWSKPAPKLNLSDN